MVCESPATRVYISLLSGEPASGFVQSFLGLQNSRAWDSLAQPLPKPATLVRQLWGIKSSCHSQGSCIDLQSQRTKNKVATARIAACASDLRRHNLARKHYNASARAEYRVCAASNAGDREKGIQPQCKYRTCQRANAFVSEKPGEATRLLCQPSSDAKFEPATNLLIACWQLNGPRMSFSARACHLRLFGKPMTSGQPCRPTRYQNHLQQTSTKSCNQGRCQP